MRERLETLLDAPYEELNVSTFHAFCVKLLRDEALEACVDPFLTPVTPADRLALLLERIGDLSLRHHEIRGNPAPLLASFVSRIDRLKDELISADELRAWAERAARRAPTPSAPTPTASASSPASTPTTTACSDERGALDFGDLIVRAFKLLHERPHVRERTARRFRHVLVDEYQDTNFAQGMLLRLLVEDHANVTVVGDDDQAIYRFRGASQKNLLEFERELPGRRRRSSSSATSARAAASSTPPARWSPRSRRACRRSSPAPAAGACASGAAAPSARRRRRSPPRPSA